MYEHQKPLDKFQEPTALVDEIKSIIENVGILDKEISDYNFYNFAIGSYSPTVHLYKLKQAIKKNLHPKKIILLLDLSDIYDEGARWYDGNSSKPMLRSDWKYQYHLKEKKFKPVIAWKREEIDYGSFHSKLSWAPTKDMLAYSKYRYGEYQSLVYDIKVFDQKNNSTKYRRFNFSL